MRKSSLIVIVAALAIPGLSACETPQEQEREQAEEGLEQRMDTREEALEQEYEAREQALEQEQEREEQQIEGIEGERAPSPEPMREPQTP